jgi:hypothetical protein
LAHAEGVGAHRSPALVGQADQGQDLVGALGRVAVDGAVEGAAAAGRLHADYQMGARVLLGGVSSGDLAALVRVLDHVLDRLGGAAPPTPG